MGMCRGGALPGDRISSSSSSYVCVCVCVCLEGNIPVTVCYRCAAYCCIVLLVPLCCVY